MTISMSADYRLVFDKEFELGKEVSSHQPKCVDAVPVAIVHLAFDSGPTKNVFFQADKRMIHIMIDYLRVIDKELDIGQRLFDLK